MSQLTLFPPEPSDMRMLIAAIEDLTQAVIDLRPEIDRAA